MKSLAVLVLLSSVVLLCSAVAPLELVTCDADGAAAARRAMHHINDHHEHGYKFRLLEVLSNSIEKTDTGCNIELNLNLGETECHNVIPKHFEDCEFRSETSGAVTANCSVKMTLELSDAQVKSFTCSTKKAMSNKEMVMICPDCPTLIALNDPDGRTSVDAAVEEFNKNTSNTHYFVLKEVGRMRLGYIPMMGSVYFSEIALQESNCPMNSRIVPAACHPLCPKRAMHAVCKASFTKSDGIKSVDCEYFPAEITEPLGPSETCVAPPDMVGPPVPPGPVQPVPGDLSPRPAAGMHPCHTNPGLEFHPICDWPHH